MLRVIQDGGRVHKNSLGEKFGTFSSKIPFEFIWSPQISDRGFYALELEDLKDPEGRLLYFLVNMRRSPDLNVPGDKIVEDYDGYLSPGTYVVSLLKQGKELTREEAVSPEAQKYFKLVASLEFEVKELTVSRRNYPSSLRSYTSDRFEKISLSPSRSRGSTPSTPGKDLSARSLSTPPTPGKGLSFMEMSPLIREDRGASSFVPTTGAPQGYEYLSRSPYSPFRPSF